MLFDGCIGGLTWLKEVQRRSFGYFLKPYYLPHLGRPFFQNEITMFSEKLNRWITSEAIKPRFPICMTLELVFKTVESRPAKDDCGL